MNSSKKPVIADTGYLFAFYSKKDQYYRVVAEWEESFGEGYRLVTTPFVVLEVYQMLLDINHSKALSFMELVEKGEYVEVIPLERDWVRKFKQIVKKYKDKSLDFADMSILLLADQLNLGDLLTIDQGDFSFLTWDNGGKYFNNLLQDILIKKF